MVEQSAVEHKQSNTRWPQNERRRHKDLAGAWRPELQSGPGLEARPPEQPRPGGQSSETSDASRHHLFPGFYHHTYPDTSVHVTPSCDPSIHHLEEPSRWWSWRRSWFPQQITWLMTTDLWAGPSHLRLFAGWRSGVAWVCLLSRLLSGRVRTCQSFPAPVTLDRGRCLRSGEIDQSGKFMCVKLT